MKDSVLKIAALALLLIVFVAVAMTARWADESAYDHVNRPSEGPDEVSSQSSSPSPQTSRPNAQAYLGEAAPEVAFSDGARAGRSGNGPEEPVENNRSAARRSRLSEETDDGGEPPDDNKDTYGSDDVE